MTVGIRPTRPLTLPAEVHPLALRSLAPTLPPRPGLPHHRCPPPAAAAGQADLDRDLDSGPSAAGARRRHELPGLARLPDSTIH